MVTATLVLSNLTSAALLLCLSHFMMSTVQLVLFIFTGVMSVYYVVALLDMVK